MSLERATFRGDSSADEFQAVLKRFKTEGCNLLVTGPVSEDVTEHATRTLLGSPDADRKRVVALADSRTGNVSNRLPPGVDPDGPDVWLIDQQTHQRSVPQSARSGDFELPDETEARDATDEDALSRLREEIVLAIDYFEESTGGLDPADLRLSVSSLDRLAHVHGPSEVARFVRAVGAMVRGVHGMAHYHLPRPDDDELVERLSPLFDARIELRKRDGLPTEQRWHVPEHDRTTDWVHL